MQNKMCPHCFKSLIFTILLTLQYSFIEAKNYGGNYDWRLIAGGPIQLFSLHIGTTTSFNHNNAHGYTIGGSFGWNYLSGLYDALKGIDHVFDLGIRLKYNFNHTTVKTHLVGTELYLHFPGSTTNLFRHIPQPFSLIIGGGGLFVQPDSNTSYQQINGGYVEVGVGVLKYFVINMNLLYRFSFFPPTTANPIEQSFHIEFAFF